MLRFLLMNIEKICVFKKKGNLCYSTNYLIQIYETNTSK